MLYTNTDNLPNKYLLEFYSQTCPPCKTMKPLVEELAKNVDVVMLDAHENIELAMKYKVVSVPTFILVDDGVEMGKYQGAMTAGQLRDFFDSMG